MPTFPKIYQELDENRTFWKNCSPEMEIPLTNFTQDLADDERLEYYPHGFSFLMIKALYEKYLPNIELNTILPQKFMHELMHVSKPYFFIHKNSITIQKKNQFAFGDLAEEKRMTLSEILIILLKDQILNKNYQFQKNHTILLDSIDSDSFVGISFAPPTTMFTGNQLHQKTRVTKRQIVISRIMRIHCTKYCGFLEKKILM